MKRILILAALFAAAVVVSAQSPAKSQTGNTEQIIRQHVQDWTDALLKVDYSVIDRVVAPEWMLTQPEGALLTKVQADVDLKSGALKFTSMKIDDLKVAVFGDVAVAYLLETEKSSYRGSDGGGQYRWTNVFAKRDGVWKAVASHGSRVAVQTENTEQIIRQLQQEWVEALPKADFAVINRIVAPDWMLTRPEGVLLNKTQADADLKSGALKFASLKIDEMKVAVYGDTAVVYALETEKSSYKGSDGSGQYRVTVAFVKRNGTWQAVTTTVTKVVQ